MVSERKFISENVRRVLLREHIKKEVERAGFGGLEIQRTPMGTRVTLIAERPGMVIGRKGKAIKNLTDTIEKKFTFDNPQIEVQEVKNPNLNANIMARKLADSLERGWKFRRAGHSTVQKIMGAGAKGCQVIIAGKLTGERHRTAKFTEGHIKHSGETANIWMDKGYATALTKPGILGVKVFIMNPDAKLPDEIRILTAKKGMEEKKPEKIEEEKVEKEEKKQSKKKEEVKKPEEKASSIIKKLKKKIKKQGAVEELEI
ncbi:MAG: 30S ribosomal protein S3 [Euryarchaeota archaeon CG01_land_8_20_14_3_00_38_12]|nr:MAG: 30S ribosomal protein S3 [Euryarchaeota archaeon CG01_land_8_20_14_3_00_38_12]